MFLRYFARTDETEVGRDAAAYCDTLVKTGIPVRLVSARVAELQVDRRGRSSSCWDKHRDLLVTPMDDAFVNVVCGMPDDWVRFHTPGARNVLLLVDANTDPAVPQTILTDAVERYDLVYVPSAELADVVERVTGKRPSVVPFHGDVGTWRTLLGS